MKDMQEKKRDSQYLYRGRILNLRRDTVELPNGKEAFREVVEHSGAVACLAVKDGRAVFVKQFRSPLNEEILEIPAGRIEKGENPEDTVVRELKEEVGIEAKRLRKLGSIFPTPGYSDEIIHLYLTDDFQSTATDPDEDEFVQAVEIALSDALALVHNGEIKDAKTICALLIYKEKYMREGK